MAATSAKNTPGECVADAFKGKRKGRGPQRLSQNDDKSVMKITAIL